MSVDVSAEIREPLHESDGGSTGTANNVGTKEFGHPGRAGPVRGAGADHGFCNGELGRHHLSLLGQNLHEQRIIKDVYREVNDLGQLPDHLLGQPRHRQCEVVNIHLGNDDVGPTGL